MDFKKIYFENREFGTYRIQHDPKWGVQLIEKKNGNDIYWMNTSKIELAWMNKAMSDPHIKGDILIGGLGFGLVVFFAKQNKDVKSITVLEKSQDCIDLITSFKPEHLEGVTIINSDVESYKSDIEYDYFYNDAFYARLNTFEEWDKLEKEEMEAIMNSGDIKATNHSRWLEDGKAYFDSHKVA